MIATSSSARAAQTTQAITPLPGAARHLRAAQCRARQHSHPPRRRAPGLRRQPRRRPRLVLQLCERAVRRQQQRECGAAPHALRGARELAAQAASQAARDGEAWRGNGETTGRESGRHAGCNKSRGGGDSGRATGQGSANHAALVRGSQAASDERRIASDASASSAAAPSPVPWKQRLLVESAWRNASKITSCCSGEIPMPVSVTRKRMTGPSSADSPRISAAGLRGVGGGAGLIGLVLGLGAWEAAAAVAGESSAVTIT